MCDLLALVVGTRLHIDVCKSVRVQSASWIRCELLACDRKENTHSCKIQA
jgi:hypothetical protein